MRLRSQIVFVVISTLLILAIVGIGIYSNGLKKVRKLEKTVQATLGDLEWRFEERDEYLSRLLDFMRKKIPANELFHQKMKDSKETLIRFLRHGEVTDIIQSSQQLDGSLRDLWKYVDAEPILKEDPEIKAERQKYSEIEEKITSFRTQYNEAVRKYNRYLKGIPGRFLGKRYGVAIAFPDPVLSS